MRRVVWGLDPGTTTGLAIRRGDDVVLATALSLPSSDARYSELQRQLRRIYEKHGAPDFLYYEKVIGHLSSAAGHVYGGLYAALVMELEGWVDAPIMVPVYVATLKKWATGSGRAQKKEMVGAAAKRWPDVPMETNDVADALWLADYGVEEQR